MKIKLLLVSAIAIVGMAVYTLTLSFTNTTPLLSQLEALASGEGGESGGDGGESGGDGSESGNTGGESGESGGTEGENPESGGQQINKGLKYQYQLYCQRYGYAAHGELVPIGEPGYFPVVECYVGEGICTRSNPCEILVPPTL